jgi:hypothetical protein
MTLLLLFMAVVIGIPAGLEVVLHPRDNLVQNTSREVEEKVIRPIQEQVRAKVDELNGNYVGALLMVFLGIFQYALLHFLDIVKTIFKF